MTSKSPPALSRATTVAAKTVYRELRRAGHSKEDVLAFVGSLLEQLSSDATADDGAPAALVDAETGLLSSVVAMAVLDREVRRAVESNGRAHLAVAMLRVTVSPFCSGETIDEICSVLASTLRTCLRTTDAVGRIDGERYLVILPGATARALAGARARLAAALTARCAALKTGPTGDLRISWSAAAWDASITSGAALCARCIDGGDVTLVSDDSGSVAAPPSRPPTSRRDLADAPRRRAVALALGGGAARAIANAGVIAVLREAGVEIVGIAATSNGALVGAMTAVGMDEAAIVARFEQFFASRLAGEMRRAYASSTRSLPRRHVATEYFRHSSFALLSDVKLFSLSNELFDAFVTFFVGVDRDLASLSPPLTVAATDLASGRLVTIAHGSLHAALRATCAIPGLFPPQLDGSRVLVDGALIADVPVRAARLMERRAPVVAVHLDLASHDAPALASSLELAIRGGAVVHAELVREQIHDASFLITVPVADVPWLDFRSAKRIAALGTDAARRELPRLLAHLDALRRVAALER